MIYTQAGRDGKDWARRELANDSGWMSRVADVDGEGSCYEVAGAEISNVPETAEFLQYRATFFVANGSLSPKLSEVTVQLAKD